MKIFHQRKVAEDDQRVFWILLEKIGSYCIPFAVCLTPLLHAPFGEYIMERHNGTIYKNVWKYPNIVGHTDVLMHWGTFVKDSKMCTLIAEKFGQINGEPVIQESKFLDGEGFNEFMKRTEGEKNIKMIVEYAEGWAI